MKKHIKLKGRIRTFTKFSIYLGFLLLAVNAAIFLVDYRAGIVLAFFTVFYFGVTLFLYFYNKPVIINELTALQRSMDRYSVRFCGIWICPMHFWMTVAG